VNERLMRHGDIDATDIEVTVSNGEVTLSGAVDDRRTRRLAEDVAENVTGVTNVINRLRVGQGSQV
jgi:osmotically-inducible protein OsmY